jgi:hypothetical protein
VAAPVVVGRVLVSVLVSVLLGVFAEGMEVVLGAGMLPRVGVGVLREGAWVIRAPSLVTLTISSPVCVCV